MSSEVHKLGPGEASALVGNAKSSGAPNAAFKHRPEGVCEAPGCGKPVPGGMVHFNVKGYFCSKYCKRKVYNARKAAGLRCKQCGGPVPGNNDRSRTSVYCKRACFDLHLREKQLDGTGPFLSVIEKFLAEGTGHYTESSKKQARSQLAAFFRYVNLTEKLTSLEQITPRVVTGFVAAARARGINTANPIALVSPFFRWAQDEELFTRRSPIVPRIHGSGLKRTRQPYDEDQMTTLRAAVDSCKKLQLKLMFAIGEECGLRNSEVCNIRLEDVNSDKQTIHVRLPTKNKEPRTVHFHNKVKRYLQEWLRERDPRCEHDHLFHTDTLRVVKNHLLDGWFKQLYGKKPEPAASFEFHRLRHTWATRLVNGGMELSVLQELGGWKSLSSVQIYAKIRKSTVDRQYQAAYSAIEEKLNSPEGETLSLVDFALMNATVSASGADSAS
jgi:integrase